MEKTIQSKDYNVDITITKPTTVVEDVKVTTAKTELVSIRMPDSDEPYTNRDGETVVPTPTYYIKMALKDADGNRITIKNIHLSHDEAIQMLPELGTLISNVQTAISNNIDLLLSKGA